MSKQGIKALSISTASLIWDKGAGETPLVHTEEAMREEQPSSEVSKIEKEAHFHSNRP